jgi:lysine 2,3-aminomutase
MASDRKTLTGSPAVPLAEVARRLGVADSWKEADPALHEASRRFPVRLTRHYLDLAVPGDAEDPIRRIAFPDAAEIAPDSGALADPVGERERSPVPFVVRKHADRAILLVTARCHVYCRFCFRRAFPDGGHRDPDDATLEHALDYLEAEPDLREVILSGGDPLVLPDDTLRDILSRLAAMPQLTHLRIHTRAPVHDPARITAELASTLQPKSPSALPVWVVVHFNHPSELTPASLTAVRTLLDAGLSVLNQSVLLAGVNDSVETLEALCRALVAARVKPYYLHHPDRVEGAGAFWVDIDVGLGLYRELRQRLGGGIALPRYVIDPPDGSGKVPVETLDPRRGVVG